LAVILVLWPLLSARAEIDPQYLNRIDDLKERLVIQGFDGEALTRLLADDRVVLYPQILERRGKGLNYMGRRFGLLTKRSITQGVQFLSRNRAALGAIEQAYGVDREILVAILRVETNFGSYTGNFPVFNSLLTRAVIENRRSQWAEEELVYLLRFTGEQGSDPLLIKGSWAGAFGIPQFIPSSYVKYAVDGNGDGRVNLYDVTDALASVASYLRAHGWERGNGDQNRKAVYAYNHCDNYVDAVFAYAQATKKVAVPIQQGPHGHRESRKR
jgi:membrane-bound lytic murein transglycosylase B